MAWPGFEAPTPSASTSSVSVAAADVAALTETYGRILALHNTKSR
jgi:hypothetical protein